MLFHPTSACTREEGGELTRFDIATRMCSCGFAKENHRNITTRRRAMATRCSRITLKKCANAKSSKAFEFKTLIYTAANWNTMANKFMKLWKTKCFLLRDEKMNCIQVTGIEHTTLKVIPQHYQDFPVLNSFKALVKLSMAVLASSYCMALMANLQNFVACS